jgi:transposase
MKPPPDVKQLSAAEIEALLARLASGSQTPDDVALIRQVFGVLAYITELVARKDRQLKTLLKRLFGFHSERAQKVRRHLKAKSGSEPDDSPSDSKPDLKKKKKPKGHGRNGADDYSGAEQLLIAHSDLSPKDACPECLQGRVYEQAQPGVFIRFTGMPGSSSKSCFKHEVRNRRGLEPKTTREQKGNPRYSNDRTSFFPREAAVRSSIFSVGE